GFEEDRASLSVRKVRCHRRSPYPADRACATKQKRCDSAGERSAGAQLLDGGAHLVGVRGGGVELQVSLVSGDREIVVLVRPIGVAEAARRGGQRRILVERLAERHQGFEEAPLLEGFITELQLRPRRGRALRCGGASAQLARWARRGLGRRSCGRRRGAFTRRPAGI